MQSILLPQCEIYKYETFGTYNVYAKVIFDFSSIFDVFGTPYKIEFSDETLKRKWLRGRQKRVPEGAQSTTLKAQVIAKLSNLETVNPITFANPLSGDKRSAAR